MSCWRVDKMGRSGVMSSMDATQSAEVWANVNACVAEDVPSERWLMRLMSRLIIKFESHLFPSRQHSSLEVVGTTFLDVWYMRPSTGCATQRVSRLFLNSWHNSFMDKASTANTVLTHSRPCIHLLYTLSSSSNKDTIHTGKNCPGDDKMDSELQGVHKEFRLGKRWYANTN